MLTIMKYVIANWKAELTSAQVKNWIETFKHELGLENKLHKAVFSDEVCVIICPSFIHLAFVSDQFKNFPQIKIGAQTVSEFSKGKFTGEISAESIADIADYAIIGHSERRKWFNLSEQSIEQQLNQCADHSIRPILCIGDVRDKIYPQVNFVAYEPPQSIGSGYNLPLKDLLNVKDQLHISSPNLFLYGGSVSAENSSMYLNNAEINGVLVGSASLNVQEFIQIITTTHLK